MSTLHSLYKRHWALIPVVAAVIALLATHLWTVLDPYSPIDTPSYFEAWERLKSCRIDCLRTPVYPVFAGLITDIFGRPTATVLIILVQTALYLVSVYALARICRDSLRMPRWLAIVATVPYYALYVFKAYQIYVITDAPATSLTIIFALFYLRCLRRSRPVRFVLAGLFAGFLVLLRPSFLFIPIAMLMTAPLARALPGRKARGSIVAALICLAITGAYTGIYFKKTGIPAISCVSDLNAVIMNANVYSGDYDRDSLPAHWIFDPEGKKEDPPRLLLHLPALTNRAAEDPRFLREELRAVETAHSGIKYRRTAYSIAGNLKYPIAGTRMRYILFPIVAVLYGLGLAINIRKRRSPAYIGRVFIWLLVCGLLAIVMLRAPDQYARLLMPVTPFVPVMCLDMAWLVIRGASLLHRGSCGSRE